MLPAAGRYKTASEKLLLAFKRLVGVAHTVQRDSKHFIACDGFGLRMGMGWITCM